MSRFIALLRGINVGGRNAVAMPRLRALCDGLGWKDVQSYIQSGNVLFTATGKESKHEATLEQAIREHFGLTIPVVIRSADMWQGYANSNPFPVASEQEPNRVMLALSKSPPKQGAAEALRARAVNQERITAVGDAIWIHFPDGQGGSKLSPALLDRLVGSCVTMRNWRTVLKLCTLASAEP